MLHAEVLGEQGPAIPAVDHRYAIAMRHIHPVRGGIKDHVVPPIRSAERHRAGQAILGHRLCSAEDGESQRERDGRGSMRRTTEESFHAATLFLRDPLDDDDRSPTRTRHYDTIDYDTIAGQRSSWTRSAVIADGWAPKRAVT